MSDAAVIPASNESINNEQLNQIPTNGKLSESLRYPPKYGKESANTPERCKQYRNPPRIESITQVHTVVPPLYTKQPGESIEISFMSSSDSVQCDYIASTRKTKCKNDDDFNLYLRRAQDAIRASVHPQLIPSGSSGSYFIRDIDESNLAVFKPKDEEPFAPLNPKWPKFFQKILCFCCFGRACLIPNNGYLSETGASIVDEMLSLNIVPKTRVVKLASSSFFYARCCGRVEIKPKEGSFQLFVHGYESAQTVFSRWDYDPTLLSIEEEKSFTYLFQKMCVLDYVIRNTDRHMDNLLIKHIPGKTIALAAIDNGLAFPVKHPESISRFRTFPFRWAEYKWAQKPWNESLRKQLLSQLCPLFLHNLCRELKVLFNYDHSNSRSLVYNQLRVLRGQIFNLYDALVNNETPARMSRREPLIVSRKYRRGSPATDSWDDWFKSRPIDYNDRGCC